MANDSVASYGVRYILEVIEDEKTRLDFLKHFWIGLLFVYVTQRCPPIARSQERSDHSPMATVWDELNKLTLEESDVHKVKVVFVMNQFKAWYPSEEGLLCQRILDSYGHSRILVQSCGRNSPCVALVL